MTPRPLPWAILTLLLAGCDGKQAFKEPEWTLSRMLRQPRLDPFDESPFFDDGRAMRPVVPGTVARDAVIGPLLLTEGATDAGPATVFPLPVTRELVELGRKRFDVVCAPCHGFLGDGQSVVASKMQLRKPPSLHEPRLRALTPGDLYRVVHDGYGLMPSYDELLGVRERWAVVAYVRALQRSQYVPLASLPAAARAELERAP